MGILLGLFGAEPIQDFRIVEGASKSLIIWAVPAMILFTALEIIISYYQNRKYYETKETIGSIGVGLGNLVVGFGLKLILLEGVVLIYNWVPWRMELNWWTFLPCYIIYDLCSYWAHRVSHQQRFWWATHVAHHSGEYYNLAVSFRLSWVQHLKIIFFLPVAFIGFHPVIFFITYQLAVLFQFWVHTEYIRRLHPIIEYIFATPSNHRVHHGSQEKYIDKNYAATFIFWDRMFGTYQPEEEQVIYGLTTNIEHKANPFYVNFHEYIDMWKDVKSAKGVRQKLFYVFGSPTKIMLEKKAMMEKAGQQQPPVNKEEEVAA